MEVNTEREGNALIVKVGGRVDGANAREFEEQLNAAIAGDNRNVIVDLEELSYISSAGLRAILLVTKSLKQRSAQFSICSLNPSVSEVFQISGFDKIITVHPSRANAVQAAGG